MIGNLSVTMHRHTITEKSKHCIYKAQATIIHIVVFVEIPFTLQKLKILELYLNCPSCGVPILTRISLPFHINPTIGINARKEPQSAKNRNVN